MTVHELQGRAHAAALHRASPLRASPRAHPRASLRAALHPRASLRPALHPRASLRAALHASRGQGTVEYVGLILLIAVLIAGVVSASRSFSDTGIAEAVVKKIKGAIDGVAEAR